MSTFCAHLGGGASGKPSPFDNRAARSQVRKLLPIPPRPYSAVTVPAGMYGYQSHLASWGAILSSVSHSLGVFLRMVVTMSLCKSLILFAGMLLTFKRYRGG